MGDGITSAQEFNSVLFNDFLDDVANYEFVRCFQTETDYNTLRKNLPPYLAAAGASLDLTESDALCGFSFKGNSTK